MLAWPTLIEGVERINVVIVNLNQWAVIVPRHDPYAIEVDYNRNCYSYRGFRHIVRNYRN